MAYSRRRNGGRLPKRWKFRWIIVSIILFGLIGINLLFYNPFLSPLRLREQLDAARRSSIPLC
ncbi:MAG TPA: hypothetical protein VHR47_11365 [Bacillota bacterium]|nr:hypothetical protein [Bacillota bacterium]